MEVVHEVEIDDPLDVEWLSKAQQTRSKYDNWDDFVPKRLYVSEVIITEDSGQELMIGHLFLLFASVFDGQRDPKSRIAYITIRTNPLLVNRVKRYVFEALHVLRDLVPTGQEMCPHWNLHVLVIGH